MKLTSKRYFKKIILIITLVSISACGGGGSGGENDATLYIENSKVLPVNGETDVGVDPLISFEINSDLLQASVTTDSFQLLKEDLPIDGQISFVGTSEIHFSVDNDLNLLTRYSGKVTTDIADIDGRTLQSDKEWSFMTRDGIWQEPTKLKSGEVDDPVVIDAKDSMWLFYLKYNDVSGKDELFSRYRQSDGTFSTSKLVSNNVAEGSVYGEASAKVFSNGDVLAVWQEDSLAGKNEVWYNYYTDNNGAGAWGKSERLVANDVPKRQPKVVSNKTDDVSVFFKAQSIGENESLRIMAYNKKLDEWSSETTIADAATNMDTQPSIAMDYNGNIMLIWFDVDTENGGQQQVWSRYYDSNLSTWGDVTVINSANSGDLGQGTELVVDLQNNFTAVWSQKFDGFMNATFIWANRFHFDTGWETAVDVAVSANGSNPEMAVNNEGKVMLLYQQINAIDDIDLLFSGYDPVKKTWTAIEPLENNDQPAGMPQLTVDDSGNMMAIWRQNQSGTFITKSAVAILNPPAVWIRRFGPSNSGDDEWGQETVISLVGGTVESLPSIAHNEKGEIWTTWLQKNEGVLSIQGRYFE